jgi:hypothetical protein
MIRYLFIFFYLGLSLQLVSCKIQYVSKPFNISEVPSAPDYSNEKYWAVLPNKIPNQLQQFVNLDSMQGSVDIFYVYPTLFKDPKNSDWNADVNDDDFNKEILDKPIHYQASAWIDMGRLFAPYYRQSHYRIYINPFSNQSGLSYEIAYTDVKTAFEYYLKYYNNGRPIIIAAHSQGSAHSKRLLKEFFDGKSLQKQLVAAYIPGIKVMETEFKTLKPMTFDDETGGYLVWNSYKKGKKPKKFDTWFKGGVTSNPITWNNQKETDIQFHKGTLYTNDKIYPQSISLEVIDGLLWISVPKVPKRFFLRFISDYHFGDINLYWEDIRINSQQRIDAYWRHTYKSENH